MTEADEHADPTPTVAVSKIPTDDDLRAMAAKRCCGCCKGTNLVAAELLLRRERARQAIASISEILEP